jgi:amino acid adenylation domain-containing protein
VMDAVEQTDLIELGTGVRTEYPRDSSVGSEFSARAFAAPEAVAIRDAEGTIAYGELDRRSNALAWHLRSLGVGPGTAVGVAIERSADLPVALLAILKLGAHYVPLDPANAGDRTDFIIDDAGVVCIVSSGNRPAVDRAVRSVNLLADAAAIAARPSDAPVAHVRAGDLAYVMYTSGSTGRPKGVAVEHRAILRLVLNTDFVAVDARDVVLQFAPSAFDASTFEIWAPLLNGAVLAIAPAGTLSLEDLGAAIERLGVTTLWLTAPLFRHAVDSELHHFTGLRTLLTGGDTVSPEHAKRYLAAAPSTRLINGYGPTENTTFSCCFTIDSADRLDPSVPIGRPIANSTAYVLDEHRRPVPVGTTGELYVGGDGLARGYVNLPELTAERFTIDPFSGDASARLYRTGDLARWRNDGELEFLGRADRQIKIRGFRVELEEIEAALQAHPLVLHAVVVVTEREREKHVTAVVVPTRGAALADAALRAYLAGVLPTYMMPNRFVVRDSLPEFTSGKIDRLRVERDVEEAAAASTAQRPIRRSGGEVRDTIQDFWREIVGAEPGLDENFFDAGGDSLLLLALHRRLKDRFGIALTVTALFAESTIRKQALLIERLGGS